jgi:glycerate dehydrogenase
MKVIISTRQNQEQCDAKSTATMLYTPSVEKLLSESDFVSLHCPLNNETKNFINADSLKLMKKSAFLINTARGGVCDEPALIAALQNNQIAGAALDVQVKEPPVEDSPLYTMPNVILTPHIGWKRKETRQRGIDIMKDNIASYLSGTPVNVVGK